eukprot:Nitzschia sp. Nitz4//scaffold38_size140716//92269//93917//NITZ4_003153-RA/size140716-augustus-gene-0.124-mRNA-1//1//CDS//3329550096//5129//frame0
MSPRSQETSILVVSAFLFTVSAYWRIKGMQKEKKDEEACRVLTRNNIAPKGSNVSSRCARALTPVTPYLEAFIEGLSYLCDETTAPDGYVPLCTAENKLVIDLLAERLMQPGTSTAAFSHSVVYSYDSFVGLPVARKAVAYFIARRFYKPEVPVLPPELALAEIKPEHVGIGAGAAGVLNSLYYLLGEAGDACLVPAPFYAAFESITALAADIVPFAVHMADPMRGPTEKEMDMGYVQARSRGLNPRFVLVTNPNNPLGVIYKPDVICNLVRWARKRKLHTIVDEVFALSIHDKNNTKFQSVIRALDNNLGDDVHFVWSMSKDFGACGLRFGIVYSQNQVYIEGLANLNIFSAVSNPIQMVVSELLTDDPFVDSYLEASRLRLKQSYEICVEKLEEMVLPFLPAEAGMFVYVDFSSLLPEKTMEWEAKLSRLFVDYGRLILTPGESQKEYIPGMFRICYAWVSPAVLRIGMERLSKLVAKVRRLDWADLNEQTMSGIY